MYTLSTGCCLLLVLLPLACTTQSPAPEAPAHSSDPAGSVVAVEVVRARKEAAAKPRRIIFNDDGGDLHDADSSTPEGFLGIRLKRLAGTQVDTVAWSITKGDAPNYDSRIQPVFGPAHAHPGPRMGPMISNLKSLIEVGHCPLQAVVDFCHANGMEAFASLRMNDVHDSMWYRWITHWKRNHPQFLVDRTGMLPERKLYVTAQDFVHQEVRERKFEIIEEVCQRYDIDGIELDFIRQPVYFSSSMRGVPVDDGEVAIMTGFLRRIRRSMDEIATRRGRPLLLAARVPDTFHLSRGIGLDLEQWAREGLVDILIAGGGYAPNSLDVAEFARAAQKHGVLVYPCFNTGTLLRGSIVEQMRALAANWRRAGADGSYLWNMFGPQEVKDQRHVALDEIGEPETLAGKTKLYGLDAQAFEHYAFVSSPTPLPRLIQRGTSHEFTLAVADELAPNAPARAPTEIRMELRLQRPTAEDPLRLRLNGVSLEKGSVESPHDGECKYPVAYALSAPPLRTGENTLEVSLPEDANVGRDGATLCGVQLRIEY